MDAVDVAFQVPFILRLLCYLTGMAVFLTVLLWLRRRAFGRAQKLSLGASVGLTLMRVLSGCALASLLHMMFFVSADYPHRYVYPELSILLLMSALYLLLIKERPLDWSDVLKKRLPAELGAIVMTLILSIGAWGVSIALGVGAFLVLAKLGAPPWFPIFAIGLAWNAPLVVWFTKGQREGHFKTLKFYHLLWPVLLAYLFIMLPDIAEQIGNNPKIHQMMDSSPPIVRL